MARTIAVVSGKGGVGKTTTTANLAMAMQKMGERVVAVDCDQAASNLALQLDMHPEPDRNLQSALEGKNKVNESIRIHRSGLMVMPSTHAIREKEIKREKLRSITDNINGTVLIDAPPGLTKNVYNILAVADEIIIVTNPEIPAVTDAVKVTKAVEKVKGSRQDVKCIVTKADEINHEIKESEIHMALEVPVVSKVPYDKHLKKSIFDRNPVVDHVPHTKSAIEYKRLAAQMTDNEYQPPKMAGLKRILTKFKGG